MSGYMQWLADKTPGAWWIDSSDPDDVKGALSMGAAGITTNPLLCARALQAKPDYWREVLGPLPSDPVDQRAQEIIRRMTVHAASWVKGIYDATKGVQGYVCCQVNPKLYGEADAQVEQARIITKYAPNVSVKLPMSRAGLIALEQCIAEGISVTGTVSFTLSQVLAIGEACERGSGKARAKGINPGHCNAVIMIGRLEDYLMFAAKDMGKPELCADIPHAGVLVVKKAVKLFAEKNYSAVLLPSGMRGVHQIQNLAGIKGIFSISPNLAEDLENQDAPEIEKVNEPADENLVRRLGVMADFRSAYLPGALEPADYIAFGSFQQTITQFYESGWLRIGALT
jgi:transaldolase